MTGFEIAKGLQSDMLVKGDSEDTTLKNVVSSDLMGHMPIVGEEDILLLTSPASDRGLHTIQVVGTLGAAGGEQQAAAFLHAQYGEQSTHRPGRQQDFQVRRMQRPLRRPQKRDSGSV